MIAGRLQGQMGNHLFIYAFTRIVAEHRGYEWGIVNGKEHSDPNPILHRPYWYVDNILHCDFEYIENHTFLNVYTDINDGCGYNKNLFKKHNISSINNDTLLKGIFQSKDVVENINTNWFVINTIINIPQISYDDTCIIHYRGLDYHTHFEKRGMNKDFVLYFKEAIELMNSMCGKRMRYLVITDDISRAKQFITADDYMSNSSEIDFSVIYNAKYIIMPVSTFSWWASFLSKNREICIAPSGWEFYKYKQKIQSDYVYTNKFLWI